MLFFANKFQWRRHKVVRGITDMVFTFVEVVLPKTHRLEALVLKVNIGVPNKCAEGPLDIVDFRHLFYITEDKARRLALAVLFVVRHITDFLQHKLGF